MPLTVKKIGNKWRLVGPGGTIEKNKSGTPVDGGGHSSKDAAIKQMQAININKHKADLEPYTDLERATLLGLSIDYFYSLVGSELNDFSDSEILNFSFALKIDETENQYRVRVKEPSYFDTQTFKTKEIKPGLTVIVGRPKGSAKTQVQSFRFAKDTFDKKDVQKFIKENSNNF